MWLLHVWSINRTIIAVDQSHAKSSNVMYLMFGASTGTLVSSDQHGLDTSQVYPIDPFNSVLFAHSFNQLYLVGSIIFAELAA
jgi:hypothetical protein